MVCRSSGLRQKPKNFKAILSLVQHIFFRLYAASDEGKGMINFQTITGPEPNHEVKEFLNAHRLRLYRPCIQCDRVVNVKLTRPYQGKYCSRECQTEHCKKNITCDRCGKKLNRPKWRELGRIKDGYVHHFCNISCSSQYHGNKRAQKTTKAKLLRDLKAGN